MELLVRNGEGNLTQKDREYAAKKFGKLERYFHSAQKVEMVHREDGHKHRVEITVFADGFTVRGEEHDATSVPAAIDKLSDKLESRLRKLKGRIISSHRRRGHSLPPAFTEPDETAGDSHNGHIHIRERKTFLLKPMSPDEAALQMEMIDHPFFIFKNEDTNQMAVLYKRKSKGYGLIEPEA
jgi:putative sigma-54 modulation protein